MSSPQAYRYFYGQRRCLKALHIYLILYVRSVNRDDGSSPTRILHALIYIGDSFTKSDHPRLKLCNGLSKR